MARREEEPRNNKRTKRLYVEPKVQGVLARRVIFHFIMFIVVGAMVGLFLQFLGDPFKPVKAHIKAFWSQSGPYVVALLCMIPVFIKDTLALTHRMAGPIVRLRGHLRSLADGEDVPPLKFRDGDFFSDVPPLFNEMMETVRSSETNQNVDELIRRAAEVIGAEDTAEMDMALKPTSSAT